MRESGGDEVGSRGPKPKRGTDHSAFPISIVWVYFKMKYSLDFLVLPGNTSLMTAFLRVTDVLLH